ncbi:MAG: DUF4861 family protein [Blastocatellia bacterium]|nr:DUF4861 family protein [Blastocatellia bacterium]
MTLSRIVLSILAAAYPASYQSVGQSNSDWLLPNFALRLSVQVSNPGNVPVKALATIPVEKARIAAPDFPGRLALAALVDEGKLIASQADDLDGDGTPDQFEFPVELAAGERRRVDIYYSTTLEDSIAWPKRVQAKHSYGYNRQVAALESELIGYRTYGGFFLDMQGRAAGRLGLNNDLAAYVPLRLDLGTGRDVFHIGDTLGLGGIYLRRGGRVYRPPMNVPDYAHKPSPEMSPHYRVIAQGPLRAIVEATMDDWKIEDDLVRLKAQYSIDAGESFVRCRFEATPVRVAPGHEYEVGIGIRDLQQESRPAANGRLIITGQQDPRDGAIGLALYYDENSFAPTAPVQTAESSNQAVAHKTKLAPGQAVSGSYTAAGAWTGSGIANPEAFLGELAGAVRAKVEAGGFQFARTPRPDKVDAEVQ